MPRQSTRPEEPDERHEVLVHYMQIRDAATREKRDTWIVFLGLEKHTECATRKNRHRAGPDALRPDGLAAAAAAPKRLDLADDSVSVLSAWPESYSLHGTTNMQGAILDLVP
ncbi:MAG TPA: hypothetical protein VEH53_07425 [archaeon]|nr:hypothetical protein [archaeon]